MMSMLEENIFKIITLYDYQALCLRKREDENGNVTSSSTLLLTVNHKQIIVDNLLIC